MNIHIIGVCGTFMGGVARLARELGYTVSGSDANTYPPMSTQLASLGIALAEGYRPSNIPPDVDIVLVGNTISRGNPELEHVLDKGLAYTSGAQWLRENVLRGRWVLAVAGTHGKTTTSSILTWILQQNGLAPGYLIGGVPENFGESSRLGETPFFVIEADEYDTAFCDKRSKFVHYEPKTLILNNLEFDHADIFNDLAAIQTQFHHLIKIMPRHGQIISNADSPALTEVLDMGTWSESITFGQQGDWQAIKLNDDGSRFQIKLGQETGDVQWDLIGEHNMYNALAAVAAARHVGVPIANACGSLSTFKSVKRRLEKIYEDPQVCVFDDFAHHPTAIRETLDALRQHAPNNPILAILEPRSNTMKRGVHKHLLKDALQSANNVMIYAGDQVSWDISSISSDTISAYSETEKIVDDALLKVTQIENRNRRNKDSAPIKLNILIMSNGGFDGLHKRITSRLENR